MTPAEDRANMIGLGLGVALGQMTATITGSRWLPAVLGVGFAVWAWRRR